MTVHWTNGTRWLYLSGSGEWVAILDDGTPVECSADEIARADAGVKWLFALVIVICIVLALAGT